MLNEWVLLSTKLSQNIYLIIKVYMNDCCISTFSPLIIPLLFKTPHHIFKDAYSTYACTPIRPNFLYLSGSQSKSFSALKQTEMRLGIWAQKRLESGQGTCPGTACSTGVPPNEAESIRSCCLLSLTYGACLVAVNWFQEEILFPSWMGVKHFMKANKSTPFFCSMSRTFLCSKQLGNS